MQLFVTSAGELELWNKAEAALEEALNSTGREWVMNPGDGAFYGPKIDITGRQDKAVEHILHEYVELQQLIVVYLLYHTPVSVGILLCVCSI